MDWLPLARGLALGFSIAAVFGPIGVLCLRRTLTSGFAVGFSSGLGAATADAAYAALAGLGLTALATLMVEHHLWLRLVGGGFLVYLGVLTARSAPAPLSASSPLAVTRLAGAYTSTLALTLSNPMTILSFAAIFAGLGLGSLGGESSHWALALVVGVFVGSAAWWLVLTGAVARLRSRITARRLHLVNVASGLLIFGFGVQSLLTAVGLT
jgi:threonine/homoserine/homoserine lactone efflux protein